MRGVDATFPSSPPISGVPEIGFEIPKSAMAD
jgi:hypothetical protein